MGKQQILFITILYILSLYNVLARKQYEDLIYFFSTQRKEIDTQQPRISVVYGPYKEVGSFSNKNSNNTGEFSYTYSPKNSRKFSTGIDIGANNLGIEIKDSWRRTFMEQNSITFR